MMSSNDEILHSFRAEPLWDSELIKEMQNPIVIAGPCSAESEEQLLTTAKELKAEGYKIFRAGVWKPRTYPGSFEGVGAIALKWLQTVRKETGMLVGCEVGTTQQAELALDHRLDFVWIGARTTSSPFSVNEIAEALKGSDISVLVKNPLSPSIDLWKGALIRLISKGIKKIGALHRGFDIGLRGEFRYPPKWGEVIQFHDEVPGLPFYFDPSHIAGNRSLLHPLIHKAKMLGYDGFMIESHYQPELAWSDPQQQVTPRELKALMDHPASPDDIITLYRKEMDHLDEELIRVLALRRNISMEIGAIKSAIGYTAFQEQRYNQTKEAYMNLSKKYGVPQELSVRLFEEIHRDSKETQENL